MGKVVSISVCRYCGKYEGVNRCSKCGAWLCDNCKIKLVNEGIASIMCPNCVADAMLDVY